MSIDTTYAENGSRPARLADLERHAHWLLRIGLASVFVYHGVGKLVDVAGFATMMGLSLPVAWLVTLAEVGAGLGIIVGAFGRDWLTRLSAAVIAPVMAGAIALVHWGKWSFVASETHPMGGMEFQVVLMFLAAYLAIRGNRA